MPIYEFECSVCSRVSEHIMKISDKNPEVCPCCQSGNSLTKLMSRTSFVLKGQGWYETDFKKKENKSSENAKSSAPVSSAKTSEPSEGVSKSVETSDSKSSSSGTEKEGS